MTTKDSIERRPYAILIISGEVTVQIIFQIVFKLISINQFEVQTAINDFSEGNLVEIDHGSREGLRRKWLTDSRGHKSIQKIQKKDLIKFLRKI